MAISTTDRAIQAAMLSNHGKVSGVVSSSSITKDVTTLNPNDNETQNSGLFLARLLTRTNTTLG